MLTKGMGSVASVCAFALILLGPIPVVLAWDHKTTHRDLSNVAAQTSILGADYLTSALGILRGLDEILHWDGGRNGTDRNIRLWIQDGAQFEDDDSRYYNHFHNPLLPWNNAGLNDSILGKSITGDSALLWAQDQGLQNRNPDWSWQATRQHFYLALTSVSKSVRDAELAQTFVGVGHVIHLIQDMSQPAHVRNDAALIKRDVLIN